MLRIILLLIVSFLSLLRLNAQERFGKIKCDAFQVMVDTNRAVIYRKKKTTVFDKNQKRFLMKPTKSPIVYFSEYDLLVTIEEEKIIFTHIGNGRKSHTFFSNDPAYSFAHFPSREAGYDSIIHFNYSYLNYKNGTVVNVQNELDEIFFGGSQLEILRSRDSFMIFNHYQPPSVAALTDTEAGIEDEGFARSGVYSTLEKKWVIPPVYERCERFENNIFCLKREAIIPEMPAAYEPIIRMKYVYDVYKIEGGEVRLIENDIRTNDELNVAAIFDVDSVKNTAHSKEILTNEYVSYKNGKQGLLEFQLFNQINHDVIGNANLSYKRLLSEDFDFVLNDLERGQVISLNKNSIDPIVFYTTSSDQEGYALKKIGSAKHKIVQSISQDGAKTIFLDDVCYNWAGGDIATDTTKVVDPIFKQSMFQGYHRIVGLDLIADSLLIVYNYKLDSIDPFAEPLKSIEYPDEDSLVIDANGFYNAIYPAAIAGYEYSGVYNLSRSDWFIAPENSRIYDQNSMFLIAKPMRDPEHFETMMDDHFLKTHEGDFVFSNINYGSNNSVVDKAVKQIIESDSIIAHYEFPNRSFIFESCKNRGYSIDNEEAYYYVLDPKGWTVLHPSIEGGYWLEAADIIQPKEFIHYDPFFDYVFWLEGDSIFLKMDEVYRIGQNQGELRLLIQKSVGGVYSDQKAEANFLIQKIEKGDTTIVANRGYDSDLKPISSTSISIIEGDLIVNENQFYDNISPNYEIFGEYPDAFYENYEFRKFQTETSAIWREKEGNWIKKTPFYASVEKNQLGYLVSTGDFEEFLNLNTNEKRIIEGSYILLNQDLKPLSFMDFFEFENALVHDFGIQLCAAGGCYLVGNDGQLISGEKWETFELEEGKIKAIRYVNPDVEEGWDHGELIEEVKYFKIPK